MKKLLCIFALLFTASLAHAQTPYAEGYCTRGATTNGSCQMTASGSGTTALTINTAGDTIVVQMGGYQYWSSGQTYSMSGTGTGGFTCAPLNSNSSYGFAQEVCWALASASGSYSPTCSSAGGTHNISCSVAIFPGSYIIDTTTTPYAGYNTSTNSTAMQSGTTTTTAGSSDIVIGAFQEYDNLYAMTAGSGWTAIENHGTTTGQLLEYQIATPATFQATGTLATANTYSGYVVALMPQPLTAATPTLSPNGVALGLTSPATTVTITSTTSGATDIYTTDGSTPGTSSGCTPSGTGTALTQSGTTGVTVNLSSAVTLKAIACESGYANSSVASAVFNLLPDQPIMTASEAASELAAFYNPLLNIDTIAGLPTQLPLDTAWTGETLSSTQVSAWKAMGYGSGSLGQYVFPALDSETSSYGMRGGNAFGFAIRTAEGYPSVYPANQYAKAYSHIVSGSSYPVNPGVAVGTNCSAGSGISGNILTATSATSNNVQLYINGSVSNTVTVTVADGDSWEFRQDGTICQPLHNGATVAGLSATYSCTAATANPCVGATGIVSGGSYVAGGAPLYNPSVGAVATSSPGVTPLAWSGNTYSNYASGTITSSTALNYPTWMPDGTTISGPPASGLVCCNVGGALSTQYALGSAGSSGSAIQQAHLLAPVQNLQWVHQFVTIDATAWNLTNDFLKFASLPYNPPSAMAPNVSGCYDAAAGYIGTEPMQQGSDSCGASVEYCNTHKLHVTYANNQTSTIAQATANLGSGGVASVTFTSPRCLSATTATVYFWGGTGSGATATANMTTCSGGYQLSSVTMTANGSYTVAPNVTIVPGSGGTQSCASVANYEIATAIGLPLAVMHGDEVLGVFNQSTGNLSIYVKGGSGIGGWAASTTTIPRVISYNSGTTGTTIQAAGLYQVAISDLFQASFAYPLNGYIYDGTHWQQVTTAGTTAAYAPTWNGTLNGTTTSGGVTFTNRGTHPSVSGNSLGLGVCSSDPCTGATQPSTWGGTTSTCEVNTQLGALTPDGTTIWQCVAEAAENDSAFQFQASVNVPGFNDGWMKYPGIWTNSNAAGYGAFAFQDVEAGSGNPCTNGKYTCAGGAYQSWSVLWP